MLYLLYVRIFIEPQHEQFPLTDLQNWSLEFSNFHRKLLQSFINQLGINDPLIAESSANYRCEEETKRVAVEREIRVSGRADVDAVIMAAAAAARGTPADGRAVRYCPV